MVDASNIDAPLPGVVIYIERGPVTTFAAAVKDRSPVYKSAEAARSAGFADIPIPPTYPFAMANWGAFSERQPADAHAPSPMEAIFGELMAGGGLILHGEQEFLFHGQVVVGDVLTMTGRIKDIYEKASGEKTMTFVVSEQEYRNQRDEHVLTQITTLIHRG
jgi:hypothetical protein